MSQTAYRTHHATEVTEALVGQKVTLAGWVDRRRDHGGVAFIDLRDNTGLVQIVIYDEEMARPLRSEFVIQVTGEVRLRPDGNENTHLATGKIEVVVETIDVLAKSDALPFQVSTALENESENKLPGEDVRLKYRYLDLGEVHLLQRVAGGLGHVGAQLEVVLHGRTATTRHPTRSRTSSPAISSRPIPSRGNRILCMPGKPL